MNLSRIIIRVNPNYLKQNRGCLHLSHKSKSRDPWCITEFLNPLKLIRKKYALKNGLSLKAKASHLIYTLDNVTASLQITLIA